MSALWFIRHGQASFSSAEYDALSPLGEEQARRVGAALRQRGVRPDRVWCGAMRRHQQTAAASLAELSAERHSERGWDTDPGWNEYDHNDVLAQWDARYSNQSVLAAEVANSSDPQARFEKMFSAAIARWTGGQHDPDYRESCTAFHARVAAALDRVQSGVGRQQNVLVFTSGGVISSLCRLSLGLDDAHTWAMNLHIANASVTKLVLGRRGRYLSCLNDHAHLEGAQTADGRSLLTYF